MAVVAEDDDELSMWPVAIAAVVLALLLGVLLLMMALNDDTGDLPTNVSHHHAAATP